MARHKEEEVPFWALWTYQHGFSAVIIAGLAMVFALSLSDFLLDRGLVGIDERINPKPPAVYSPPDLAKLAAPPFDESDVVRSQAVYVPVESHIYYDGGRPFPLEATLFLRNTNLDAKVIIRSVRYYDTDGDLLTAQVIEPIVLAPLQTVDFVVQRRDSSGGSGANFLVEWCTLEEADPPLIEAVLVGNAGTYGIGYRAQGVEVSGRAIP